MKRLRNKPKPPYPLVECPHHKGDPLPGYVVCVHAVETLLPSVVVHRATRQEAGSVLCPDCAAHPDLPVAMLKLTCVHFVAKAYGVEL